jgi:hypothetical protein
MSVPKGIAERILAPVSPDRAFLFYAEVDRPLNVSANSLRDFGTKVKEVDLVSLEFHLKRGDFEKWIYMLGDAELVKSLMKLRESNLTGDRLRAELVRIVQTRVRQLQRPPPKK